MTSTFSKYFPAIAGGKRRPSSSSASDASVSPDGQKRTKQNTKKPRQHSESVEEEMAMQEALCELKAQMSKLATKEDVQTMGEAMRGEMEKLCMTLTNKVEKLESRVFDLENEKDRLYKEVKNLKTENSELRGQLTQCKKEVGVFKRDLNDQEQHGRQWNLRVFGVREVTGEETVEDCVSKCVKIFSDNLGVPVSTKDVEIAHRSGRTAAPGGRPRPILIRFFSRRQRGLVLAARRKLKQTGISIGEDLTWLNYQLLKKVNSHSASMTAWSSNGKVLAKLKNGKTLRIDVNADIDSVFMKEMA